MATGRDGRPSDGARPRGEPGDGLPRYHRLVRDAAGQLWICPDDVDEDGDLVAQGCWRSGVEADDDAADEDETEERRP